MSRLLISVDEQRGRAARAAPPASGTLAVGLPLLAYLAVVGLANQLGTAPLLRYLLTNGVLLGGTLIVLWRSRVVVAGCTGSPSRMLFAALLGGCFAAACAFALFVDARPVAGAESIDLLFLIAVVPVAEELYFRELLLRHLRAGGEGAALGALGAIVVTAALFGALHWPAGLHLPMSVLGLVLGAVAVWSRGVLLPIAFHATWNALATIWAVSPGPKRLLPLLLLLGVLLAVFVVVARRRRYRAR